MAQEVKDIESLATSLGVDLKDVRPLSSESESESEVKDIESLATSLGVDLKDVRPLSFESGSRCCIYKIPEILRKREVQAYKPDIVSIGPYHYNKKDYASIEVDKLRCLTTFLGWTGKSIDDVVQFMRDREIEIRKSYAHDFHLLSYEFVRMVLLDAIFAFSFILGGLRENEQVFVGPKENDQVFGGSSSFEDMARDMLLLENQLPFFIFVDLLKFALNVDVLTDAMKKNIYERCYKTFCVGIKANNVVPTHIEISAMKHMVDFLRHSLLPPILPQSSGNYNYKQEVPTATELHEAGAKFKVASSNKSLIEVKFNKGVLEIPLIYVNFRTETLFRNVLAFEQCHCDQRYITEYIYLMDCLINTPKDVELLVRNKIMVNNLGDNEAASTLFNNLGKGLTSKADNNYYGTLFKDMVKHCNSPCHKWMAILKHDYFDTPMKTLSIVVASIIIGLTLTGVVYAILAYKNDRSSP